MIANNLADLEEAPEAIDSQDTFESHWTQSQLEGANDGVQDESASLFTDGHNVNQNWGFNESMSPYHSW